MAATFIRTLTVRSREEGASEVARALHNVTDAYKSVIRTTEEGARVVDMTAAKLARTEDGWKRLTGRLEGNSTAYRNFIRESTLAKQALDAGLTSVERYSDVVGHLRQELQAAGASKFGFSVDQSGLNQLLGVRASLAKSARESASVFEEEAKVMEGLQLKASRLRAELDPLGAAYERMNAQIAEFQELADRELISQGELARATERSRDAFDKSAASLKPVNDNIRLTGGQVQNLGYQLNDIATSLASGASPFQVLAQQGGQVLQALQDGPGGLAGSIKAIGAVIVETAVKASTALAAINAASVAASVGSGLQALVGGLAAGLRLLNPFVAGIAAIGVASAAMWWRTRDATKDAEAATDAYAKALQGVKSDYAELGAAIDAVLDKQMRGSAVLSSARVAGSLNLQKQARASGIDSLRDIEGFAPQTGLLSGISGLTSMLDPAVRQMQTLYGDLLLGRKTVADFQEDIAKIRLDPSTSDEAKKIADQLIAGSDGARKAEASIKALTGAVLELKGIRFDDFGKQLREFVPDTKSARERINELADAQSQQALSMGQALQVEKDRQAALGELDRAEQNRRAGIALDIKALSARTVEEKAALAAERARLEASNDPKLRNDQGKISQLAQEASDKSRAESKAQYNEAIRQQTQATKDQVAAAQEELQLFGKSAGETARLRAEFEMLAQAKEAARSAGFNADTVTLTDEMKAQAAAIGEATAALEKMSFQRDLVFRLQQSGRSDQDQRIADQLRSSGIDFDSQEGQARAQQLRYVESVEKTSKALKDMRDAGKDAFADLIDAIGQGDNAFDAIISSFARFGQQLSSAGFDKLFGGLFGTANPTGSAAGIGVSASSLATTIGTVGASLGRSGGVGSDYASAAPVKISTSDLASASGQIMAYSSRFNSSVDKRLLTILNTASSRFDMPVSAISGLRPGDPRYHGQGLATDVQILGANGQPLGNYQDASTFRVYERFAQMSKQVQSELFPELDGMLRWGGYFSGAKGKYGALDTMHFDLAGNRVGMGGGSWAGGLTASQRALFPGATSVGMGANDNAIARGVSSGTLDAQRKIAAGAVPGIQPSARTQRLMESGQFDGVQSLGGMTPLQGGMTAVGAGIGAFSQGYQSGSPIGGAISGALGGFSTGAALGSSFAAIGAAGGPVGAIIGAGIGLIGGLLGKSKQKKEAQKQKWAQAEEAWKQNLPQFMQFEDEVSRTERGPLSQKLKDMQATLQQFDDLAKKGKGDRNNDQIRRVRAELADYVAFLSDNFIRDLPTVIGDLGKGQGIDTAFTKARDNVMQTADSYRGFLKDITDAYAIPVDQKAKILSDFEAAKAAAAEQKKKIEEIRMDGKGNPYRATKWETIKKDDPAALAAATATRDDALAAFDAKYGDAIQRMNEQLEAARNAAVDGLLKIVSGDMPEQSDIEKAIQESAGAASGLRTALVDLGKTAEETGALIDQALSKRMDSLRKDFTTGLQDKIDEFDGKGYLASVRDLIKSRDGLLKDADLLNVDTSLVDTFFTKSAQSLVDGAELTGDAFNDLIKLFPELTGKVKAFGEVVSSQTVQEGLKGFLSDRLAEATQKRNEAESDLLSVYNESKDRLEGFKDSIADFLKNIRLSDQSPLSQKDQFLEAQKTFRDLQAKALAGDKDAQDELVSASQSYLDEARAYYKSSDSYFASFNEVESVLKSADTKATSQLDLMKSQVGSLVDISDTTKSIDEAIKALADAIKAQKDLQDKVDGGRSFGLNPERNRLIDAGVKQLGLNYSGNYGLTNGVDQFLKWRSALPADQRAAVEAVINQYIGLNKQMGGLIPGFAAGGIIGNGLWNKDSVLARYQNGGSVALAGGEMVISAPKVTPRTYPVLDAINRTGVVPANGNGGVSRAEFAELSRKIDRLTAVVAAGAQMTTDEVRRGNGIAQEGVDAQRKQNSRAA